MLTVVFVDDEPFILQAMARTMRPMRTSWDMVFVESGDAALAVIEDRDVDVIVSDMRMPGMDGAELLDVVRRRSPRTARIVLSGFAEEDVIRRSTEVAHQFLSKPCELDVLKKVIEGIQAGQAELGSRDLETVIGLAMELPSLPSITADLVAMLSQDGYEVDRAADLVSGDIALTAEVMRLVNSAFFGLSREVASLRVAVSMLGSGVLLALATRHTLLTSADGDLPNLQQLNERSRHTSEIGRQLALLRGASPSMAAEVFLTGSVHEVGCLLFSELPGIDRSELELLIGTSEPEVDRSIAGADRFAIGSYLLGLWGFSAPTISAVASLGAHPHADEGVTIRTIRVVRTGLNDGRIVPAEFADLGTDDIRALVSEIESDLYAAEISL